MQVKFHFKWYDYYNHRINTIQISEPITLIILYHQNQFPSRF